MTGRVSKGWAGRTRAAAAVVAAACTAAAGCARSRVTFGGPPAGAPPPGGPAAGSPAVGSPVGESPLAGAGAGSLGGIVAGTGLDTAAGAWHMLPAPFWTAQPALAAAGASLRGVRAVSERVAWASGSAGTVLRTTDGGATWARRPVPGAEALDFRSVWAFDSLTAVVASAGEAADGQARIYRTADGGRTWRLTRQDTTRGMFYDAVAFWDAQHGLVLSDPVPVPPRAAAGRAGVTPPAASAAADAPRRFVVLATNDGGRTWQRTPAEGFPDALPGEAAFAAGNAALAVAGETRAWFVTGGPQGARVYTTTTGGARWDATAVPVAPRSASAGLFAVAGAPLAGARAASGVALNATLSARLARPLPTPALAVGGDYRQPRTGTGQVVRTSDGDQWERADLGGTAPGYWSGLAYVPGAGGTAVAVGGAGTAVTRDDGRTWTVVDTVALNAVSFASSGAGWGVGAGGRVVRVTRPR